MERIREGYYSKLAQNQLSFSAIESIQSIMQERLSLEEIDQSLLTGGSGREPLPAQLRHLVLQEKVNGDGV